MTESDASVAGEAGDEDRLKDLANLSGAVGHFLINAFSAIVSNAEQIRSRPRGSTDMSQIESLSTSIVKTALAASQVARRLIDSTRIPGAIEQADGVTGPRSIDINELIKEMIDSASISANSGIECVVDLGPIATITGDASRLRSMFRHLVQNANEAMEGRSGTLTISTSTNPAGTSLVEIKDTGCGMSPDVLRQATEPFFSTKPEHTGIGLTIAQSIWRRHRGSLSIDSQPGRGTTIRLTVSPPFPSRPAASPTAPGQESGAVRNAATGDDSTRASD